MPKTEFSITGRRTKHITVIVTKQELAWALMSEVEDIIGEVDDPGVDWSTDSEGSIYLGFEREWKVGTSKEAAILVDAANILRYGKRLDITDKEG